MMAEVRYITLLGKRLSVADWARAAGMSRKSLFTRLYNGMPLHRAIAAPLRQLHGHSGRVEHRVWRAMLRRCNNEWDQMYPEYGGRGITVCAQWSGEGGFERFFQHLGPRPGAGYSIDRIDNARGYEPGNVRWATDQQQAENKRSNHKLTFRGETRTLTAWARGIGLNPQTLKKRLDLGWSVDRALTTPKDVTRIARRFRTLPVPL